jgi:hypothetical protein
MIDSTRYCDIERRDEAAQVRDRAFTHHKGYVPRAGQDPGGLFYTGGKVRFQRRAFSDPRHGPGTGAAYLFRRSGLSRLEGRGVNLAGGVELDLDNSWIGGYAYQAGRPLIRLDGAGTWRLRANSTYNGSSLTTTLINQLVTQGAIVKLNGAAINN